MHGSELSLAVWLLKGFIDEIPREYEEAGLIDGYTRFLACRKMVLPQASTGIASTAIFCLIFASNECAFAVLLTSGNAQTAPPFIPTIIGVGGLSGGDRQRVALGRAIVRNPKAFMMGEPLGALDAEFREIMAEELRALHDRMRATTVYITITNWRRCRWATRSS